MSFVSKYIFSRVIFFFLAILFIFPEASSLHAQWVMQNSGTDEKLTDVFMIDSVNAVAVGRGRSILRTSDAGKTWINTTIMLSSVVPWNAVSFCNDTLGIAAGDAQIRITYDSGYKWMFAYTPANRKYLSALFLNPYNIFVGDDSGWVHQSNDTARTWTSQKISEEPVISIFSIPENPLIDGPGIPVIFALTTSSLYIKEGASPWKQYPLGVFYALGSAAFDGAVSKDTTGFIVGVQGDFVAQMAIVRMHPQDSTWSFVNPFQLGELHSVSIPDTHVIYTCGSQGKVLKSTDGGDKWDVLSTPTNSNLNSIFFFDSKHGFAVGDSGIILYTENGGEAVTRFTAGYWYHEADSLCRSMRNDARIRSIKSNDVSIDGKAVKWDYKFGYATPNNLEFIYFHNGEYNVIFDSLSLIHDCCIMNIEEDWFDSDSALAYAELNGGKEFRENNPGYFIQASLTEPLVPDSHPHWCITYKSSINIYQTLSVCFDAVNKVSEVDNGALSPTEYRLYQNYPNPFNPVTKIIYAVPASAASSGFVSLKVYDVLGNEAAILVNKEQTPGEYFVEFDAGMHSSGIYFYVLSAGGTKISRKMILLR